MAFTVNQQIFTAIEKSQDILVVFGKDYNGDSLASSLALSLLLQKMNKRVDVVCYNFTIASNYAFLPKINEIKSQLNNLRKFIIALDISRTKVDEISYDVKETALEFMVSPKDGFFEATDLSTRSSGFKYDLIFVLGATDLENLDKVYDQDTEFFYKTPVINIDYSPANEKFGQINLINLNAAAVSEVLFQLFSENKEELITEDIATVLLTGIVASTRNFKSHKVTPVTLNIASKLITLGARRAEIIQHLYQERSLATLKLWGRTLARLKNDQGRKLAWSLIDQQDFIATSAQEENLDSVIEELIANSYEAETIVILYEYPKSAKLNSADELALPDTSKVFDSQIKVIVASLKNINTLDLVKNFSGALGNDDKAIFTLSGLTLAQAEEKVIAEIKKQLDVFKS